MRREPRNRCWVVGGVVIVTLCGLGCALDSKGTAESLDGATAGSGGSQPGDASAGTAGDSGTTDAGADAESALDGGADDLQDAALDGASDGCIPLTCGDLNASCGAIGDGCGGTLSCGTCGADHGCHANACAAVVYVDASAGPGGHGSSWADAFNTIEAALTPNPPGGTEIWVAKGTYVRATPASQIVLTMVPGVAMFGHFAATEQAVEDRKLDSSDDTVLDGEGVVRVVEAASGATLDGFTVRNGMSNQGPGVHALGVQDFRLANCVVSTNSSSGNGGGVYVEKANNVTITNTEVSGNKAGPQGPQGACGGGLFLLESSSTIDHCTIRANTGGNGGGLCVQGGKASVSSTWFEANAGTAYGQAGTGGAHNISVDSTTSYTNSIFMKNTSAGFGGGIYNSSASPRIVHCTFWGNTAALNLGADVFDNPGSPVIVNSILASAASGSHVISDWPSQGVQSALVSFSDVMGESLGGTNLDAAPKFMDTSQGNFQLAAGSPCIDKGDPAASLPTDYAGNARDSKPDMGALEHQGP